jgi:hypothetical protein
MPDSHMTVSSPSKNPFRLRWIALAGWLALLIWLGIFVFSADIVPKMGYPATYVFLAVLYSTYYFAAVAVVWVIRWCYRDSMAWRRDNEA